MADIVTAIQKELDSRFWLTEGRGSYEWDDDRYRQEFHSAAVAITKALKPLKTLAQDLTDSPRASTEVVAARRDLEAENAQLRARLERLRSAVDTIPAEIMLVGGPPYRLTFTEACLAEIVESQKEPNAELARRNRVLSEGKMRESIPAIAE